MKNGRITIAEIRRTEIVEAAAAVLPTPCRGAFAFRGVVARLTRVWA